MKTQNIYTVETIHDWSDIFPLTDVYTSKSAAIGIAKWNFNDGAQCVRVTQHRKQGVTTIGKHEILRLERE